MMRASLWAGLGLALAACTVGPDYRRPTTAGSAAFREPAPAGSGWKRAAPGDDQLRGKWWALFGDATLDKLEEQLAPSNQTLAGALARHLAARDQVRASQAAYAPALNAGAGASHGRPSQNRASGGGAEGSDFLLQAQALWEPDLWGKVRRTVEAARASAEASAADLAAVELSLRAELATDYFQLRGLDAQRALLENTVASDADYLKLTQVRFKGGVGTDADVAQAETQYQSVKAQAVDVGVARAELEHAIATLIGVPPSSFSLPPLPLELTPPVVPVGVPSQLLERRPDVAAAERRVAAANAQIGVAAAAYYPDLTLSATVGLESKSVPTLFQVPSLLWSLGASAVETLFDAGRRHALTDQARHAYEAQTADYRQAVLAAFQEVEDRLSTLRILAEEAEVQSAAVEASRRSLAISSKRYRGGVTTYLEVLLAQTAQLTNERARADILTRQCTASVGLIKALGGGWTKALAASPSAALGEAAEDRTTWRK
jgi:NodT family efflux transporter outer membrane factor (OMF) lipoprotein